VKEVLVQLLELLKSDFILYLELFKKLKKVKITISIKIRKKVSEVPIRPNKQ